MLVATSTSRRKTVATKEVSKMTSKQANIFSLLAATVVALGFALPQGGGFLISWSLVAGISAGIAVRAWFWLSMSIKKKIDEKVKDPKKQFFLWEALAFIAGTAAFALGLQNHNKLLAAVGLVVLMIGPPFMVWYRNFRNRSEK